MPWTYKLLRHLAHPRTDRMRIAVVEVKESETGFTYTTPDNPSLPGCIFGDTINADYIDSVMPDIVKSVEAVIAGIATLEQIKDVEKPVKEKLPDAESSLGMALQKLAVAQQKIAMGVIDAEHPEVGKALQDARAAQAAVDAKDLPAIEVAK